MCKTNFLFLNYIDYKVVTPLDNAKYRAIKRTNAPAPFESIRQIRHLKPPNAPNATVWNNKVKQSGSYR